MRDIIVYKCDVCDREIQLQRKPKTIETVGRCIITANCRGKLFVEQLIKTTSPFLQRTEEVVGLDNFFPRRKLFKFTQKFEKSNWFIKHDLETFPIVSVYDSNSDLIPDTEFKLKIIDKNTIELDFGILRSGTAELYVREVSIINTEVQSSSDIEATQVSTNLITGTIAILSRLSRPSSVENLDNIRLKLTSSTGQVQFVNAPITSVNANSPWSGNDRVVIRNRTYYVGFVDIFSGDISTALVSSGTSIMIDESDQDVSHILLAQPPFDRVDIIKDQILEVSKVNSNTGSLFFDNDEIFCDNGHITKLYPNLIIS